MNLRKRVEKLERLFKPAARRVAPTRDLTGMDWDKLLAEVDGALMDADADLVREIMALAHELAQEPWQNQTTKENLTAEGQEQPTPHFFIRWLCGLQDGSWRLPLPIPREVLEGFCRLHGAVYRRCEDCLCAVGNAIPYERCPVCQSERLATNLGGPWVLERRPEGATGKRPRK